jgi:hypothetical protein
MKTTILFLSLIILCFGSCKKIEDLDNIETPLYIGSIVNDATPTIIEMTYSMNLANIVSEISAFNVQVNFVNRNIDSVTIKDEKICLFLSSAIIFSDNINISYTKPVDNLLQTPSGGQATSISAQPVTNNILLIEEYTYDPAGVVFKIVNNIDGGWNYIDKVFEKIDSVYLKKFQYYQGEGDPRFSSNYTWFTKKGQYICWRYPYIFEGYKYLEIGFQNDNKIYSYLSVILCSQEASSGVTFQQLFPAPINDTVYVNLSWIRSDRVRSSKK